MDLLSKKHRKFPIYLAVLIGLILSLISYQLYGISNTYVVSGNPNDPYKPPFDNIWLRILAREVMIWIMFGLNIIALYFSQLKKYNSLLLIVTIVVDIVTLTFALIRTKYDNQIMFDIYSNLLGFLVSAMPYTILVLLSLIQSNLDSTEKK
jgi:hypothetical protein